ncbi:MAG: tetraacyldisaccharide 4'-kinase [Myxococcota bacterium]|jgi:tetraacyldisaccharide 4'-kinase|nr:tetraacyldisaccharide 4'-kinase [Myxococcota bacterium]
MSLLPYSERWLYELERPWGRRLLEAAWSESFALLLALRRSWLRPAPCAACSVLSVGSLLVGGAGKSAVVGYLAERLLRDGARVALLSRGYGRRAKEPCIVGPEEPLLAPECIGDEPAMLLAALRSQGLAPWLGVGANRASLLEALLRRSGGLDWAVLDDGFQQRRLEAAFDICLMTGESRSALFPMGPLREPLRRVWDADLLWLHGGDGAWPSVTHIAGRAAEVLSRYRLRTTAMPDAFSLLSGVGRNRNVLSLLEASGLRPAYTVLLRDHAAPKERQLERLRELGLPVLCTAKDEARFGGQCRRCGLELQVMQVQLDFLEGEALLWKGVRAAAHAR